MRGITDLFCVLKRCTFTQAKSGVEVESTEIALAFPLQSKEKLQAQVPSSIFVLVQCHVFVFKPLILCKWR